MLWVAPAALFAANVTVPEVRDRSAASAASVPRGALHPTVTSASTGWERVTVKTALLPSDTLPEGPDMLSSAESLSPGVVVVPLWSFSVMIASLTSRLTVVVPETMIVSSPSTTVSSVGVSSSVPVPLEEFAGMVILAREVAV